MLPAGGGRGGNRDGRLAVLPLTPVRLPQETPLSSAPRPRPGSLRRAAAALLVALVAGVAAGPGADAAPPAPAACAVVAVEPGVEAVGDDALPVVPLVVGLLVLGGVGAALLARRGAGRPAPRRDAPKPGRLDSN
jgi:hypothetical protein